MSRRSRRAAPAWALVPLLGLGLGPLGGVAMAAPKTSARPGPGYEVVGVHVPADGQVSVVLVAPPSAPPPSAVRISVGEEGFAARIAPVLSARSAVALVLDASADGERALRSGGMAGAADFLLQLPSGALTTVVADRRPPEVLSPASRGVADDVRATSSLRGAGERATAAALDLAVQQIPSVPAARPVLVLFTAAARAGEPAMTPASRLRRSGAVVFIVCPGAGERDWSTVALATGGVAVGAAPEQALQAFDRVEEALQRRTLVEFPRPYEVDRVGLQIQAGDQTAVVEVDLPPARSGQDGSGSGTQANAQGDGQDDVPATGSGGDGRFGGAIGLLLAGVAAVALAAAVLARRRRPAPGPPSEPLPEPTSPPPEPVARPLTPVEAPPDTAPTDDELHQRVRELEDLVEREPADAGHWRELAAAYQLLATGDLDEDHVALASAGFRRAVDALAARVRLDPQVAASRRDLMLALTRLAHLDAEQGWVEQARAGYERAIEIGEWLVTADPNHAGDRRALELTRARLAELGHEAPREDPPP